MGYSQDKVMTFKDLWVWHLAGSLSLLVYRATDQFPKDELYGLTSQLRRAAVSISTNIAEGSRRNTTKDLCHFLTMAATSNEEVKSLLITSHGRHYLSLHVFNQIFKKCDCVGILLHQLKFSLGNS